MIHCEAHFGGSIRHYEVGILGFLPEVEMGGEMAVEHLFVPCLGQKSIQQILSVFAVTFSLKMILN